AKEPEPARAERRSKPFGLPFWRLKKVTRRKGGTLSSLYRSNGYVLGQPEQIIARQKTFASRLTPT
ncbi:hypothetical protein, partial [Pseudomonas fluorescens]|uniref:hypothetical protein n=1 Tax=Pseudomonas fluorescens TaxID=294 RepID=UPI001F1DCF50